MLAASTVDADWQAAVMNKNAFVQNHTLSVQGGNERTTYYLSLNYSNQKGVIVSNANRAYRVTLSSIMRSTGSSRLETTWVSAARKTMVKMMDQMHSVAPLLLP